MTEDPSVNAGGRLMDHNYDGIQEYDNPTPGWWHLLFLGSVAFSLVYAAVYHFDGPGRTPFQKLAAAESAYYEALFGEIGELENDPHTLLELGQDERWTTVGRALFVKNCAQCHNADGGGLNGPNLTDDAYINVKSITDIYDVITNGVGAKGMPAWGALLKQNERVLVAAYVASLRGRTAPGGKAPEGEPAAPWPALEKRAEAPGTPGR